jgi:MoCo/4Fe-4S cofactor protein with predicted Tat translocation signal
MKSIPPSCPEPETGHAYWRSLDELADTPEFRGWLEREFPAGASELTDPVSRRHFVKIMSASFLLAGLGLSGCRRPVERILPFSQMPEGYVHGVPQYYATAMPSHGGALPLVVKTSEGRPIKIEGNALHPDSNGATDLWAQASILDLYDPDRAMKYRHRGNTVRREAALDHLDRLAVRYGAAYRQLEGLEAVSAERQGGQGLAFLLEPSSSPTRARLMELVRARLPKARWYAHDPVDFDIHRRAASLAFGHPVAPRYQLEAARVILALDCDFLGTERESWRWTRGYARSRRLTLPTDSMSRLYAVEALFSLTGANADHRLRLPAGQVVRLAAQLAARVLAGAGVQEQAAGPLLAAVTRLGDGLPDSLVKQTWLSECARDLLANRGAAVVMAGHRQPLEVHLIAQALNVALGAPGRTLFLQPMPDPELGSLKELAESLRAGEVESLVISGANPVYSAPADLEWGEAQRLAKSVVRLGYHEDETAQQSEWHLPLAHFLESWGDARTPDGMLVPVQPLIEPLFGGVTEIEVLARVGGVPNPAPYDLVRETFQALTGSDEERWKRFLHDGFLADGASASARLDFDWAASARAVAGARVMPLPGRDALEVVFHRDAKVDDGRENNNGWLQELPDPVTKMTWENVVLLSQRTADELGLKIVDRQNNNLLVPEVTITVAGRAVTGPAWIQPGMADHVVALALGYGRAVTGRVGKESGYNAYRVRGSEALWAAGSARLVATGAQRRLATTQNHWAMEGRPIIREANLGQYREHPRFAQGMNLHEPPGPRDAQGRPAPMYPNPLDIPGRDGVAPRDKSPHAWGMTVDLNACTGCSACMIACQSENNVPIVGKDLVSRNREMHWLRLDRYYSGPVTDPQMVTQPMMCQHCESAPCESVCPVNATVHDEEGLNVMAYNRCVGTRYCSNNCPYKVRRFNYLDYHKRPLDLLKGPFYTSPLVNSTDGEWDLLRWFKNPDRGLRPDDEWEMHKLVQNPDVTVRMRGVMEKCTFCVQRIQQAKIQRKVRAGASGDIEVPDGMIQTACQQACPAEAIAFGNLNDPGSAVSKLKQSDRDYSVLEFLLTKPRATYLARVRNPNPAMPDYEEKPLSFREWEARGNRLEHHAPAAGAAGKGGGH